MARIAWHGCRGGGHGMQGTVLAAAPGGTLLARFFPGAWSRLGQVGRMGFARAWACGCLLGSRR